MQSKVYVTFKNHKSISIIKLSNKDCTDIKECTIILKIKKMWYNMKYLNAVTDQI